MWCIKCDLIGSFRADDVNVTPKRHKDDCCFRLRLRWRVSTVPLLHPFFAKRQDLTVPSCAVPPCSNWFLMTSSVSCSFLTATVCYCQCWMRLSCHYTGRYSKMLCAKGWDMAVGDWQRWDCRNSPTVSHSYDDMFNFWKGGKSTILEVVYQLLGLPPTISNLAITNKLR